MSDDPENDMPAHVQLAMRSAKAVDSVDRYNVEADRLYAAGIERDPGFEHTVATLKDAGVMSDDLILQAMEVDDPVRVFEALAKDPDQAKEIAR